MEELNIAPNNQEAIPTERIYELADNQAEAEAVVEIMDIISETPGAEQMFDHEINDLNVPADQCLKQFKAERDYDGLVDDVENM